MLHVNRDFKKTHKHDACCTCPACLGLVCLERPRFYAGQLLTESELNSLQAYVKGKNRLHNRYLHGSGVVCGLQVICHDCEGWVTLEEGYAIGPCGDDIIVCDKHDFDLIGHIKECRDKNRYRNDCNPVHPNTNTNCLDVEEQWCITIAYEEKEVRPMASLRSSNTRSCRSCGSNQSCGCRTENPATNSNGKNSCSSNSTISSSCEPTRIVETYHLDVCEAPPECYQPKNEDDDLNLLQHLLGMEGTLLSNIIDCFEEVIGFVNKRLPENTRRTLYPAILAPPINDDDDDDDSSFNFSSRDQYDALCRLHQAVRDLYLKDPLQIRCASIKTLNQLDCPPSLDNESVHAYSTRIRRPIYDLVGLIVQYLIDCICQTLLPKCPPPPCNDKLILACVTVKNNEILRICNFSCRDHAGAFPTVSYWLSIIPVIPLLKELIAKFCCSPALVRAQSPLVNDFLQFLDSKDPTGNIRQELFANDFAVPKSYVSGLDEFIASFSLDNLIERFFPKPNSVNLDQFTDLSILEVISNLNNKSIKVNEKEVSSLNELPKFPLAFANPGDSVIAYVMDDKVVGYKKVDLADQEVLDKMSELEDLQNKLTVLQGDIDELKARSNGN